MFLDCSRFELNSWTSNLVEKNSFMISDRDDGKLCDRKSQVKSQIAKPSKEPHADRKPYFADRWSTRSVLDQFACEMSGLQIIISPMRYAALIIIKII